MTVRTYLLFKLVLLQIVKFTKRTLNQTNNTIIKQRIKGQLNTIPITTIQRTLSLNLKRQISITQPQRFLLQPSFKPNSTLRRGEKVPQLGFSIYQLQLYLLWAPEGTQLLPHFSKTVTHLNSTHHLITNNMTTNQRDSL